MPRYLIVVLLSLASTPLWAGWQLGLGFADEIDRQHTGLATLSWLSEHPHPWEFMGGYLLARGGRSDPEVPDALFLALSKRISGRRWFLTSGIAFVDEDNEVLSGHFQFMSGAGYSRQGWTISLRHLSNASTSGRNRGETFLLLERRLQ